MYNPFIRRLKSVERYNDGTWSYEIGGYNADDDAISENKKLKAVLKSPAALKVFKLNCDLFTLCNISVVDANGKPVENDPFLKHIKDPNLFQTNKQFLWDYMFWRMMGTAYLYTSSKILNENTKQYFLNSSRIKWSDELIKKLDKNMLSKQGYGNLLNEHIEYENEDGSYTKYQLKELTPIFDTSNNFGNWYQGASAVDALYDVIKNSNKSIKSKMANLDYASKFFIIGQNDANDIHTVGMGDAEKKSIEKKINSSKSIHAIKTKVELKRFVDDIARLQLDKGYREDYFTIGSMFGIPNDILESNLKGSTFENQEKSMLRHVEYCLKPAGEDFANAQERIFGYEGKNIVLSWEHLNFMKFAQKDKNDADKVKLENLKIAVDMGAIDLATAQILTKEIIGYD